MGDPQFSDKALLQISGASQLNRSPGSNLARSVFSWSESGWAPLVIKRGWTWLEIPDFSMEIFRSLGRSSTVDILSKWTYCHNPQGFFGFDFNQVPKKKSPVLVIEKQCTKYLILLYFSHLFGNLNHDTSHPGDCYGGCKKFCTTKRMAETLPIMGCLPPIHWCRISSIHCINPFLLHPNGCVWKSGSLSFPFEGCCSGLSLIFGHSHIQLLFILMCIYIYVYVCV